MSRTPRSLESRETEKRKPLWRQSNLLPDPTPEDGYRHRWVRTGTAGTSDAANVSSRLREGYEPVKASDHQDFKILKDERSRFPDSVEVGGLLLCKIPEEIASSREEVMQERADGTIRAVDNHYMKESDGRAPLAKPQRATRVGIGKSALRQD